MRITLRLDDDVLSAAKTLAAQRHETIGEVISRLARQALASPPAPVLTRNGIPLLPKREGGGPVTMETVDFLSDEWLPSDTEFQA
jgi:hypothetical protein